jgi:CO/xanthine dehydrogenase Mo-binding subunit
MKIAVDGEGNFLANRVRLLGKAGPYACYTPAILDYALQLSCGIYYFPCIDLSGDVAYTNDFLVSAFRGFGNNQVGFAIESMVDMIAERLQLDKIAIRRRNMIRPGGTHSLGNRCSTSYYSDKLMDALESSPLRLGAEAFKAGAGKPWLKRGVGFAAVHQGVGLGNHLPDASTCEVELLENGHLKVFFGNEDMGQGSITTLLAIAAEAMHMPMEQTEYCNGITSQAPDSGPITASRVTYISGKAICGCIEELQEEIAGALGCGAKGLRYADDGINGISWAEIAAMLPADRRKKAYTQAFDNEARDISLGLNLFYSHAAQVTGVEVNTLTGETKVLASELISSSGTVINRLGYEGQCEGGVVMSQGYALYEDFREGTRSYQTYLIPTMADCPEISLVPIEDPEETGPFGAKGLAEVVSVPGTPAVVNAIHDAVGIRFRGLPAGPEKVLMALNTNRIR